jgi:hypothetical protein
MWEKEGLTERGDQQTANKRYSKYQAGIRLNTSGSTGGTLTNRLKQPKR